MKSIKGDLLAGAVYLKCYLINIVLVVSFHRIPPVFCNLHAIEFHSYLHPYWST